MGNEQALNIEKVLAVLRRHALLIVACVVVAGASAYGFSTAQTKQYTATAKLLFREPQLDQQASGVISSPSRDPRRDSDTNIRLVTLRGVADSAARQIGGGMTGKRLLQAVDVTTDGETDLAVVAATSADARRSAAIANTLSETFVEMRRAADEARILKARQVVERQLSDMSVAQRATLDGQSMRDRSESLRILAALQTGNVDLAELATVPTSASSPIVPRNTVFGAVLGLLLGVGLAFLFNRLDRRMKSPEDIGAVFRLPLLGIVPESNAYDMSNGSRGGHLPSRESEAFRTLRAHLRYYNVDRDVRTVLVTSAAPGEGKSTVARYLAEAAASMGTTTLLIEADLRRPSLAGRLGMAPGEGLGDVLIRAADAADVIKTVGDTSGPRLGGISSAPLDVLLAGALPPNPAELIESRAMEDLLGWASEQYELVVIDTPPLAVVSDAISLMRKVDGVIIVSRVGESTNTAADRLRERLSTLGAPTLGVVANACGNDRLGGYDYTYGYEQRTPRGRRGTEKAAASSNGKE